MELHTIYHSYGLTIIYLLTKNIEQDLSSPNDFYPIYNDKLKKADVTQQLIKKLIN